MCCYTKVYFNIIPTIHKKYRKQNKQPKRKLVHVNTSELSIFSSPFTFYYYFFSLSLTNIFYLALSQSEFPMNNCINVNLI